MPTAHLDTIPELLNARAAESPDTPAFWFESANGWTYIAWGEFSARATRVAAALVARGLTHGQHVGILAPTGLGWELFHHAILIAGGVVVGMEPHDIPERLRWIADHSQIEILVVQDATLMAKLDTVQIERFRAVIVLADTLTTDVRGQLVTWQTLEASGGDALSRVEPQSNATLIYTSGTTGQPKGILYRHEQVTLAVRAIRSAYPAIGVGARFVCWLPLSNLFQRIMNLAAMSCGGTVYLVSNPLNVMKALPVAQPDVFIGVPRFYEKLHDGILQEIDKKPQWIQAVIQHSLAIGNRLARLQRDGTRPSWSLQLAHRIADTLVLAKLRVAMGGRIRFMLTGSAPTPVRLLEFFDALGLPLYEAYGLSENVVPMALNGPGAFRFGTVGRPLEPNAIQLGEDSELMVRGAGVFDGYYRSERGDLFIDGFYRTGDYASLDDAGFLQLRGRKSELIKTSAGRRIAPVGIEATLEESPFVERAVVLGDGRKCLVAILSVSLPIGAPGSGPGQGTWQSIDQIRDSVVALSQSLNAHERPAAYLIVNRQFSIEAGELTPNLKLRRSKIAEEFAGDVDTLYQTIDEEASPPCILAHSV